MCNSKNVHNIFCNNGLRFKCTGCGHCCTDEPGFVYLSEKDIKNIANFLGIDIPSFIKKYTIIVWIYGEKRLSLKEKDNYDCIFFENKRCIIYPVRPYQCSSYPFWRNNLKSKESWNRVAEECPGVNKGKFYSKLEIENVLSNTPDYNVENFRIINNVKP